MTEDKPGDEADVVTKLSPRPVAETVSTLTGMISAKGMKVFAVIDQSAEAREVGFRYGRPSWSSSAARCQARR
jgi:hypothetical protein